MGFLYFLPIEKGAADVADFVAAGLEHAIAPGGVSSVHTQRGPTDGPGLIATLNADAIDPCYRPAEQTWRREPGGRFWIGYPAAAAGGRPGPEQLRRAKLYDGEAVQLLDGNLWVVPRCVAALPERASTLPRVLDLGDDGRAITRPHPRYADLCTRAHAWWLQWSRQTDEHVTAEQQIQLAADALAVNYRVVKFEAVGVLGLFGTDELSAVLRAIIDAEAIEQHLDESSKKKAEPPSRPATSNT